MHMRIGIDIDDTITNTAVLIDAAMKKYNVQVSGDYYNYTIEELNNYKEIVKLYVEDVLSNCTVKENASSVIKYFKNKGHKIYLVTARSHNFSPNIYDITIKFLNDNGIEYDELLFGYEDKKDICIEKKLDIMIDDSLRVYNSLIDTKVKPLLFTSRNNKDCDCVRVSSWLEIKDIIDNI